MTSTNSERHEKTACLNGRRKGLRIIDQGVDPEVKEAVKRFASWLRQRFKFPVRVPVYLKPQVWVKNKKGELCTGIFFGPLEKADEPFIKVATGDYGDLLQEEGRDGALAAILCTVAHETLHYFEWLGEIEEKSEGEISADAIALIQEYAGHVEHP